MFDIGWSEMAIIMLLALIIIGPKDLPRVARTVGQWVRKGRMLARDFQNSLEDMAKEAELDDVKKEIEKVGRTDLKGAVENTIDPKGDLKKAFDTTSDKSGEETVGKVLNGSANAKKEPASPAPPAKAESTVQPAAPAPASEAKPKVAAKPKTAAQKKKPAAAAKKPASTARKPAAKKPAAPRKRTAKPASSAKSGAGAGDKPSSDDGGSAMAAKSS